METRRVRFFLFSFVWAIRMMTACFVCRYQIGIYYPFFRGHAHLETKRREPWLFGDEYTPVIREAIRRRYQLMPYLYTLFDAASREGSPVLRPLVSLFLIIVWAIILTSCFVYSGMNSPMIRLCGPGKTPSCSGPRSWSTPCFTRAPTAWT